MIEALKTMAPYIVPLATLLLGFLGDRGLRALKLRKETAAASKAETEVESTKISDMEKSLQFWVENSNKMREELHEVYTKIDKFEVESNQKETEKVELKKLIIELQVERNEFKILNAQLKETIEKQDAKINELEVFIQKQNMKISTLESKLQKYDSEYED